MHTRHTFLQVFSVIVHVMFSTGTVQYTFCNGSTNYWTAVQDCQQNNMEIVMAHNETEMVELRHYLQLASHSYYGVWLGLTFGALSEYTWTDTSSVSWTNWAPQRESYEAEPNHIYTDKCVAMFGGSLYWYTQHCDRTLFYVCQLHSDTLTSQPPPVIPNLPTLGGHLFHRQRNLGPSGPELQKTWSRSWAECAAICQRTENCDVIYRDPGGNCTLYSSDDTTLNKGVSSSWRTYTRRHEQPL